MNELTDETYLDPSIWLEQPTPNGVSYSIGLATSNSKSPDELAIPPAVFSKPTSAARLLLKDIAPHESVALWIRRELDRPLPGPHTTTLRIEALRG